MHRIHLSLILIALLLPGAPAHALSPEDDRRLNRAQQQTFAEGTTIRFGSPVTLRLKAGTVLSNVGSRASATVSPHDLTYKELKRYLSCPLCLAPDLKDKDNVHYLEMLGDITILSDITLIVSCEFCGYTYGREDSAGQIKEVRVDDYTVDQFFDKGSPVPEVTQSGRCPQAIKTSEGSQ